MKKILKRKHIAKKTKKVAKKAAKRMKKGSQRPKKAVKRRAVKRAATIKRKAIVKKKAVQTKHAVLKIPIKPVLATKKRDKKQQVPTHEEAKFAINLIKSDVSALEYLKKNVSKNAIEVLETITSPKTDDQIAVLLDMKINFVRRVLNIMQGYGITNYYVAKNTNGWLSFAWYINATKLQSFFDYMKSIRGRR